MDASHPPVFVFDVLPKELSQVIFNEWIRNMKAMSALDVACCNHSWRPILHDAFESKPCLLKLSSLRYWQWLHQRNMFFSAPMVMDLADIHAIVDILPVFSKVKDVELVASARFQSSEALADPNTHDALRRFFQHCRQVTSLTIPPIRAVRPLLPTLIESSAAMEMTSLKLESVSFGEEAVLAQMLRRWGGSLRALSLSHAQGLGDLLLAPIALYCKAVEDLSLTAHYFSFQSRSFLAFSKALSSSLKHLFIADGNGSPVGQDCLTDRLLAHAVIMLPKIKTLELVSETIQYAWLPALFNSCPELDYIRLQSFRYDRHVAAYGNRPLLYVGTESMSLVEHIVEINYPVQILEFYWYHVDEVALSVLLNRFGFQLSMIICVIAYLTDSMVEEMVRKCPRLTCFRAKINSATYCSLHRLADSLGGQLEEISLRQCTSLTDQHLAYILSKCSVLERVSLIACDCITNLTVRNVIRCCPRLQELTIADCREVTADGIAAAILDSDRCDRPFRLIVKQMRSSVHHYLSEGLEGKKNFWREKRERGLSPWIE
eukprot:gene8233-9080_t